MNQADVRPSEGPADEAERDGPNLSTLGRRAGSPMLGMQETAEWLAGLSQGQGDVVSHEAALDALDDARDAAVTRPG